MEDLAAAVRDLAGSVNGVKSTVDDSQTILKELVGWKPQVDGAMQEMRADINTLRQQLGRVARNPILSLDPGALQAREASAAAEGGGAKAMHGDHGRGPDGHREFQQHRGLAGGDLSLTTPPAKVVENDFCQEAATFAAAVEVSRSAPQPPPPSPGPSPESSRDVEVRAAEAEFRIYSYLCGALVSAKPSVDCILHCVGASSTDNFPDETMENTLEPQDRINHRPSYWSSGGQDDDRVPETLTYRLTSDICIVNEIGIQPFKAYFQNGHPMHSSRMVRLWMGLCKLPMLQENSLQSFKLPRPAFCIGGIVRIELLGRVQKQATDDRFYICVCHAQVVGRSLSPVLMVDISDSGSRSVLKYLPAARDQCANALMQDNALDSLEWSELYGFSPGSVISRSRRQRYSDGDIAQPMHMLSITVPWTPGVCNEPSTEGWQSKLVERHTSVELWSLVIGSLSVTFDVGILQLRQLFLTYSDEQVAHGGDFEYYVDRDSIKKPIVMVGIWAPEINNTVTTETIIRSGHEENQPCVGNPFCGNDWVCEKIWVEDNYIPWDPGGDFQTVGHRLEVKPDIKEGRMSRTNFVLGLGLFCSGLSSTGPAMLMREEYKGRSGGIAEGDEDEFSEPHFSL